MPSIRGFLVRPLRLASLVAGLSLLAYLLNLWHAIVATLRAVTPYLQTHAKPILLITLATTLILWPLPYKRIGLAISDAAKRYGKLAPTYRFWIPMAIAILICLPLLILSPPWNVQREYAGTQAPDADQLLTHIETERKDLGALILSIFGAYGIYLTWRRTQTTEQGHITDRYTAAIEQLGAMKESAAGKEANIEVRLGAIYALERIAWDSPRDHWTIMEVLTAYIRENTPAKPGLPEQNESDPKRKPHAEIQAILNVLKRRNNSIEREDQTLNLNLTDLRGVDLFAAPLDRADLSKSQMQRANLTKAQLQGANLTEARLQQAYLIEAKLQGANLGEAQLQEANLYKAQLQWANLYKAELQSAKYISVEQIKRAHGWERAHYEPSFRRKLGLPDEPSSPTPDSE
jgi:hypothetical protein